MFLVSVPEWRLSFHFSTEDTSWPTLTPSPDCCPRWPLPSTPPPSSSMTAGSRFFSESCRGRCQPYAAALWTCSYPYMPSLCLTIARSARFCGGAEGFSAICSPWEYLYIIFIYHCDLLSFDTTWSDSHPPLAKETKQTAACQFFYRWRRKLRLWFYFNEGREKRAQ